MNRKLQYTTRRVSFRTTTYHAIPILPLSSHTHISHIPSRSSHITHHAHRLSFASYCMPHTPSTTSRITLSSRAALYYPHYHLVSSTHTEHTPSRIALRPRTSFVAPIARHQCGRNFATAGSTKLSSITLPPFIHSSSICLVLVVRIVATIFQPYSLLGLLAWSTHFFLSFGSSLHYNLHGIWSRVVASGNTKRLYTPEHADLGSFSTSLLDPWHDLL